MQYPRHVCLTRQGLQHMVLPYTEYSVTLFAMTYAYELVHPGLAVLNNWSI